MPACIFSVLFLATNWHAFSVCGIQMDDDTMNAKARECILPFQNFLKSLTKEDCADMEPGCSLSKQGQGKSQLYLIVICNSYVNLAPGNDLARTDYTGNFLDACPAAKKDADVRAEITDRICMSGEIEKKGEKQTFIYLMPGGDDHITKPKFAAYVQNRLSAGKKSPDAAAVAAFVAESSDQAVNCHNMRVVCDQTKGSRIEGFACSAGDKSPDWRAFVEKSESGMFIKRANEIALDYYMQQHQKVRYSTTVSLVNEILCDSDFQGRTYTSQLAFSMAVKAVVAKKAKTPKNYIRHH